MGTVYFITIMILALFAGMTIGFWTCYLIQPKDKPRRKLFEPQPEVDVYDRSDEAIAKEEREREEAI